MLNKNGIWKLATRTLAGCLILVIAWYGNQVWSKQQEMDQTITQQEISIKVLQTYIISTDRAILDIRDSMREEGIRDRKRDSVLQDVAFKVNLLFDGR